MSQNRKMGANVFVLCGAGISQESGISTFRDQNGLWENHSIEEVATYEGFLRHPELVHRFYNLRREHLKNVEPNAAHYALAQFERKTAGQFFLVTQNVDDLHERAGSKHVYHMHGELKKVLCLVCKKKSSWAEDLSVDTKCQYCEQKGRLRPDIVWFGEVPFFMEECDSFLRMTDIFLSIGTSGNVYPAAGFVQKVNPKAHTIEINLTKTEISPYFDKTEMGKATEVVPRILNHLLQEIE